MVNYTSYELPESGGVGAIWFRLGGIAAILLAGWLLIMRYNERKRAGAGGAYLARAANWEMNRKVHDVTNTGSEPEAYPLGSEGVIIFALRSYPRYVRLGK